MAETALSILLRFYFNENVVVVNEKIDGLSILLRFYFNLSSLGSYFGF